MVVLVQSSDSGFDLCLALRRDGSRNSSGCSSPIRLVGGAVGLRMLSNTGIFFFAFRFCGVT